VSVWRKGPPKKQGDWWVRNGIGAVPSPINDIGVGCDGREIQEGWR